MRIYTRKGDDGTTGLYHGGRVAKDSPRPTAYGDVDEAQSVIGLARAHARAPQIGGQFRLEEILLSVQRDLWVLMADLATDGDHRAGLVEGTTRVDAPMIARLESLIDEISARFEPPREFVVPGHDVVSATLDVARTVTRRAERSAVAVGDDTSLVVGYLNRLSDLLWTLARWQEGVHQPVRSVPRPDDSQETP